MPMGERESFENLMLPLLDSLYRAARALTGSEHDARDLVQTAYVKALGSFRRFRPGTNEKAWMMRILRNTWIDQLRHRKVAGPVVPIEEALLAARDLVAEPVEARDFQQAMEQFSDAEVIAALGELPESQRMALYLSDVEGLSQDEVAEVLDIAVGTVKSRVSRARALLRERLTAYAQDMGFVGRLR